MALANRRKVGIHQNWIDIALPLGQFNTALHCLYGSNVVFAPALLCLFVLLPHDMKMKGGAALDHSVDAVLSISTELFHVNSV